MPPAPTSPPVIASMRSENGSVSMRRPEPLSKINLSHIQQGKVEADPGLLSPGALKRKLGPTRVACREFLRPFVEGGVSTVVAIQKYRTPFLDTFFRLVSQLGTFEFYVVCLPIFFWFGAAQLGRYVTVLMCFGILLGNMMKDFFSLKRPPCPPVTRLMASGSFEYGMPSTHSSNAVMFPFCLVLYYYHTSYQPQDWPTLLAACSVAFTVCALICFSRLYLGMHCAADVTMGLTFGAGVLLVWFFVGGPGLEQFIRHGGLEVPVVATFAMALLIYVHPIPLEACPCFGDSVCFVGTAYGMVLGCWGFIHIRDTTIKSCWDTRYSVAESGMLPVVLRFAVGLPLSLMARSIVKRVGGALLSAVLPASHLHSRLQSTTHSSHFVHEPRFKDEGIDRPPMQSPHSASPSPSQPGSKGLITTASSSDLLASETYGLELHVRSLTHCSSAWDVIVFDDVTITRAFSYCGLAVVVTGIAPWIFDQVPLLRG